MNRSEWVLLTQVVADVIAAVFVLPLDGPASDTMVSSLAVALRKV